MKQSDELERDRNEKAKAYRDYVVDWDDPESIRESSRLYNLFHAAARKLDLH